MRKPAGLPVQQPTFLPTLRPRERIASSLFLSAALNKCPNNGRHLSLSMIQRTRPDSISTRSDGAKKSSSLNWQKIRGQYCHRLQSSTIRQPDQPIFLVRNATSCPAPRTELQRSVSRPEVIPDDSRGRTRTIASRSNEISAASLQACSFP